MHAALELRKSAICIDFVHARTVCTIRIQKQCVDLWIRISRAESRPHGLYSRRTNSTNWPMWRVNGTEKKNCFQGPSLAYPKRYCPWLYWGKVRGGLKILYTLAPTFTKEVIEICQRWQQKLDFFHFLPSDVISLNNPLETGSSMLTTQSTFRCPCKFSLMLVLCSSIRIALSCCHALSYTCQAKFALTHRDTSASVMSTPISVASFSTLLLLFAPDHQEYKYSFSFRTAPTCPDQTLS